MSQADNLAALATNVNSSGVLQPASGGTGATTSTGTGSAVLSNSPTLVTPALGTPSSGNLANCTFPILNQNTTGTAAGLSATLAVASGGTGATTLTANSVLLGNGTSAVQVVEPGTSGNLLTSNGTTWQSTAPPAGVITGGILMWGTATAPTGYLLCNGASVSTTTYAALFAVIGYTFGGSGGNFNLPDYRDRFAVGAGTTYSANSTGGSKDAVIVSHTHTATPSLTGTPSLSATTSISDPGHQHFIANGDIASNTIQNNQYMTYQGGGGYFAYQLASSGTVADRGLTQSKTTGISASTNISGSVTIGGSVAISTTGSSATNANLPPYLGIYFIIKT